jgi:23S rRNA (cytidine1920-2'-O)/16S rRNA (cytidine1409-2'-O)-methyltransferase
MARQRVDQLLVERGLAESRTRAQALIMAGLVYLGDQPIVKAGTLVALDAALSLKGKEHTWVSRGGIKLDHALQSLGWQLTNCTVLDLGASTGGFSDVALYYGARCVYAVDVGEGQLAWKLRQDSRVRVLEKTNARHLTPAHIPEAIDVLVCDASFIGLEQILPAPLSLVKPGGRLIALIKPQFEVGKGQVGKGGVVRDPALHTQVCARIERWLTAQEGWSVCALMPSPITGPEGNIEFLIAGQKAAS